MTQKIKTFIATFFASFMLLVPAIAAPALVHAEATPDVNGALNCGSNLSIPAGSTGCGTTDTTSNINHLIALIINVFSLIVGIISVIMIIIGGIRFVLSGGDSNATGSARNTVLYAVVGLIVVALAQIVVHFVLARLNTSGASA